MFVHEYELAVVHLTPGHGRKAKSRHCCGAQLASPILDGASRNSPRCPTQWGADHRAHRSGLVRGAWFPILCLTAALGCDEPPPDYFVEDTILQLIPEQGSVDRSGGPLFVVVELTRPLDASAPVVTFASSDEATLEPLPGSTACTADSDGGSMPKADAGDDHLVVLPYANFMIDSVRHTRKSGLQIEIPAGDNDVLLVRSSYAYQGQENACSASVQDLVAFTSVRITRKPPPDMSVQILPDMTAPTQDAASVSATDLSANQSNDDAGIN